MNSIVYAAVKYTQVSTHIHYFKMCSCGAVGIDGGDGNRTLGNLWDMENRSMYCAIVQNKKIWLTQSQLDEYFSNK